MSRIAALLVALALAAAVVSPAYADRGGKPPKEDRPAATEDGGPRGRGHDADERERGPEDAPGHNKVQVTTPSGKTIWVSPQAAEHARAFNELSNKLCEALEDGQESPEDQQDPEAEPSVTPTPEVPDEGEEENDGQRPPHCGEDDEDAGEAEDGSEDTGDQDEQTDEDEQTDDDTEELLAELERLADLVDQLIQRLLANSGS